MNETMQIKQEKKPFVNATKEHESVSVSIGIVVGLGTRGEEVGVRSGTVGCGGTVG